MKKVIFFDGQDLLLNDLNELQSDLGTALLDRTDDLWGANSGFANGGFLSGGVTTINGGDPTKVDISAAIAYTGLGERIIFAGQTALTLPDLSGGDNFIFLTYLTSTDTPVAHPVTGVIFQTRQQESVIVTVSPTNTPASNQVVVANAVYTGGIGPLVITDLRKFPRALGANTVDTEQIVDLAVIITKIADYLKPIVWTQNPDIWYDKDTHTVRSRKSGAFSLADHVGSWTLTSGLPLLLDPDPTTTQVSQVIIGTLGVGGAVAVSAIPAPLPGFDFTTLLKSGVIVLGVVDNNDTFTNIQAPESDDLFGLSEDNYDIIGFVGRHKPEENMWRRRNESFQSFTPKLLDDGTSQTGGNLVTVSAGSLQVAAGTSYVAGRRIPFFAPITLNSGNTDNFAILSGFSGTIDVYELRYPVTFTKRFRVQTPGVAPLNAYWLATVTYVAGVPQNTPPTSPVDRRVFSPVPEAAIAIQAASDVKLGGNLRNVSDPTKIGFQIQVEPGVIGFPDGSIRTNILPKIVDFTVTFDPTILTADLTTGSLQTYQAPGPLGLEKLSHYAIFATADHPGSTFNLVAVKVPFFKGITGTAIGGGQFQYALPAGIFPPALYPGQKVRATTGDFTGMSTLTGSFAQNQFTQDNTNAEVIASVVGNVVKTNLNGTTPLGATTNMTLTVVDNFRPDFSLTGITNFRLLGFVSTDGNSGTPILRRFQKDGDRVTMSPFGTVTQIWGGSGQVANNTYDANCDISNWAPVAVKIVKFVGDFVCNFFQSAQGNIGTVAIAPGDGTHTGFQAVDIRDPSWSTDGTSTAAWIFQEAHNFTGEVQAYMGVISVRTQLQVGAAGQTQVSGSSLYITGYTYDVKQEWGRQLIGGGFV